MYKGDKLQELGVSQFRGWSARRHRVSLQDTRRVQVEAGCRETTISTLAVERRRSEGGKRQKTAEKDENGSERDLENARKSNCWW